MTSSKVASLIAGFVGMSFAQPGAGDDKISESEKTMAVYRKDFCYEGNNLINKKFNGMDPRN